MDKGRFEDIGGEDYGLLIAAIPYYEELQRQVGEAIKNIFGSERNINVLDIGFGTGCSTMAIIQAVPGAVIKAIDNEPSMIEHARTALDDYLYEHDIMLIEDEAGNYLAGAPKNKCDAVASGLTLHNIPRIERPKILKGIYKVLAPGGIFVNADKYAQDDESESRSALEWQISQYKRVFTERGRPDLLEAWTKHDEYDMLPEMIMREGESLKQMIAAGFPEPRIVYRNRMHAVMVARKPQ